MTDNNSLLQFFAHYIESQLGIVYMEANYFQLEHRLKDIASQLGLSGIEELHQKARIGIEGQMKGLILDLATNNETSFFRDGSIFKALSEYMVPALCQTSPKNRLSLWSAASSSGQEAYSIAMELAELQAKNSATPGFSMLVSDISDTILKRAKEGKYSQLEIQRGLPAKLQEQYFEKLENDYWKVKSSLQSHMEFKKLNLLGDWGSIGPFDIIFVRNVLIYQSVENKKKVIAHMHEKLNPGGFLVLGAAESLFGLSDKFKQVAHNGAIIYQRL